MQVDHRKAKSNWSRPSLNPMCPRNSEKRTDYRTRAPWEQQNEELIEEFEKNLRLMDADVKSPWDDQMYEMKVRELEKKKVADYKFDSLFDVPQMSKQKAKQIAEYQINPPFQCSFNEAKEELKPAKKLNPEKNPITRKPWTYGELPPPTATKKIFERPATALWDPPRGDQSEGPKDMFIESGDPVLDSLRTQLRQRGAAGIAGLSRKFRIMDDSGDGKLDMSEFCKGMKECQVADLSEKAVKHLFRYFGKSAESLLLVMLAIIYCLCRS
jgi:hypothetical protein